MEFIYHLNLPQMSGRVIKYRELDEDEVYEAERNGAAEAGEDAEFPALRHFQIKWLLAAMIVAYTEPGQKAAVKVLREATPELKGPDGKVITKATQAVEAIDGGRPDLDALKGAKWVVVKDPAKLKNDMPRIFTAKELRALRALYTERHEINPAEFEMLVGKALPAPSEV